MLGSAVDGSDMLGCISNDELRATRQVYHQCAQMSHGDQMLWIQHPGSDASAEQRRVHGAYQLCRSVQQHPNVASVDQLFERSSAYVLYFLYGALAGIQPTLPLDGDNALEGFLLHYGVHGEVTPSAPVGGAGRTAGRGDSATVVELFANSGLAADQVVLVDVYSFRSRYSNNSKFRPWKREIARRLAVLGVDMSMVEADSVQILLQLARRHHIDTVHAFGIQAKATMRAADTAEFKTILLAHPAAALYRRPVVCDRAFHDRMYTAMRRRAGNEEPCTKFTTLPSTHEQDLARLHTFSREECSRGGKLTLYTHT